MERWYFVLIGRIKPELKVQQKVNRESPRLVRNKALLEKRKSEKVKGLF
jgi:hypothetical protein